MSGVSRKSAAGTLNFLFGKEESLAKPAKVYLALLTVVPTNASTGATITEATGATGYERKEIPVANIKKAEEGATTIINTTAETVFKAITAGSAKVVAWALCDSGETGKGNVICWGTATSTEISATQTPPTVATGSPELTLQ